VNRAALYSFTEADHGDRDGSSLRACAQRSAAKIVAAIHREALRIWLKGARLVQRVDAAPANTAFNTGLAIRKHADYTGTTVSAAGREPESRESALVQWRRPDRAQLGPREARAQSYLTRLSPRMPAPISVTPDNMNIVLSDLPRLVRLALGFGSRLRRGTLDVTLPDGRTLRLGGMEPGPAAAMTLYNYGFASRLLNGGDIGIAEAYLHGEWDTPDLTQFLYLFCVNHDLIQAMLGDKPLMRFAQIVRHWFNRNTRRQARRNIYAHYDIGNAFYSAWLDPSMTYSSGLFEDHTSDLTAAQNNKYRRLAEAIDVQPGQKLLEIGCGWGGFAEFAARAFGAKVVGLTISKEQRDFAQKRIRDAGLNEKVEIRLQDYRDEHDRYDRIASIEMIEAVGEQFWPKYFFQLRDRLLPGGLAGIQAITIQDSLFQTYRREVDFIQRYVFPGGMLPSPQILKSLGERFGVPVIRERIFGQDYAKTLAIWRSNFRAAWPNLMPAGFDDRFRRLWEYYLAYCEAGFLSGNIDVRQVVFAKSG
jgi:cyclopropane-fatty-acyl-phospholipid synthase